jgi:hypothetical protein
MSTVPRRVYFISGPYDITEEEFTTHFSRRIRQSNAEDPNCTYFVGDLQGTDQYAQEFLRTCGISPERVTIYHGNTPRNIHRCNTVEIIDQARRFAAMTQYSTHDITWVRPDGTAQDAERHILRRRAVYESKISKKR